MLAGGFIAILMLNMNSAAACTVTASITPSQTGVMVGEPVELVVTFRNSGPSEAHLPLAYPSLGGQGYSGVEFSYGTADVAAARLADSANGIERIISIAPNSTWSTKVYLQRYVKSPEEGVHKVNWSLRTACVTESGADAGMVDQKGTFVLNARPGNPASLENIARIYSSALDSTVEADRQTSVEALTVFPDPVVIPELQRLLKAGYTAQALHALAKFRGSAAAWDALLNTLHSKDRTEVREALRVVAEWKKLLPVKDLEPMVNAAPPGLQIEFLHYIRAVRGGDYLPIVEQLIHSSDSMVSSEAKEIEAGLKKNGMQ